MEVSVPAANGEEGWSKLHRQVRLAGSAVEALGARAASAHAAARAAVEESRQSREVRGRLPWFAGHPADPTMGLRLQATWSRDLQVGLKCQVLLEQARGIKATQHRPDEQAMARTRGGRALLALVDEWREDRRTTSTGR